MGRVVLLTLLVIALHAAPTRPKTASKKNSEVSAVARKPVRSAAIRTTPAHQGRTARRRYVKAAHVVHSPPAPTYQLHPDPDRYLEIQKALAAKGYFKAEPTGEWGDDSTDAMRRFQADQKIDDDGKIDALSLIALGLGPKHDGSTSAPLPAAPVALVTPTASSVPATQNGQVPK